MIFNLAGGNSGGGTTGWTDISSEFEAVNPNMEIYALTNGTFVYVEFYMGTVQYDMIDLPQSYLYHHPSNSFAFGNGLNENMEPITIVVGDNTQYIAEVTNGDVLYLGSIFYPL